MNANATRSQEGTDLDDRDRRALEEPLNVRETDRTGEYEVESGDETYVVNTLLGTCTCPDHEYRDVKCKHRRRVEYEAGEREVPAGFSLEQDSNDETHDESHECETCAALAEGDSDPLECWECFRSESDETPTPSAEPSRAIVTDGGVTVREAAEGAEVAHTEDTWSGPHLEYDKYGEPTGAEYYRCRDCGREALESIDRENVPHRDGCRFNGGKK